MRFIISGKNLEVTDSMRKAVTEKLGKLERYFTPETTVHVTMSVEKERQKIEVTIPLKGNVIRSEQVSNDMYVSIDLVEEVLRDSLESINRSWSTVTRTAVSRRNSLRMIQSRRMISVSSARSSLTSSRCIRKMHAYRWNCSDIHFSYS